MFQLNDQFLADLGLGALPAEQKKAFLQHIYNELEMRVGEKLTEGMSDEMLDEFGYFVDLNVEKMKEWFQTNLPDYETRQDFVALKNANPTAPEAAILSEYGAMKWLQLNRPDYPQVVASTLDELKAEIVANRDAILGGADAAGNAAVAGMPTNGQMPVGQSGAPVDYSAAGQAQMGAPVQNYTPSAGQPAQDQTNSQSQTAPVDPNQPQY
ncbi:MAG: DUF5663 domain-containing protein [Candidatus Nomurabacteria bacterium]|jgi:hypothetical protein|nr:DUF5663 domain-containing protein [Candidatus Nomurabacteria bacterium]